jgi:hypothetical protein
MACFVGDILFVSAATVEILLYMHVELDFV